MNKTFREAVISTGENAFFYFLHSVQWCMVQLLVVLWRVWTSPFGLVLQMLIDVFFACRVLKAGVGHVLRGGVWGLGVCVLAIAKSIAYVFASVALLPFRYVDAVFPVFSVGPYMHAVIWCMPFSFSDSVEVMFSPHSEEIDVFNISKPLQRQDASIVVDAVVDHQGEEAEAAEHIKHRREEANGMDATMQRIHFTTKYAKRLIKGQKPIWPGASRRFVVAKKDRLTKQHAQKRHHCFSSRAVQGVVDASLCSLHKKRRGLFCLRSDDRPHLSHVLPEVRGRSISSSSSMFASMNCDQRLSVQKSLSVQGDSTFSLHSMSHTNRTSDRVVEKADVSNALHILHFNGTSFEENTDAPTILSMIAQQVQIMNHTSVHYQSFSGPHGVDGVLFDASLMLSADRDAYYQVLHKASCYIQKHKCKYVLLLGWSRGGTRFLKLAKDHKDTLFAAIGLDATVGGEGIAAQCVRRFEYPDNMVFACNFIANLKIPRFNSTQAAFCWTAERKVFEIPIASDHREVACVVDNLNAEPIAGMFCNAVRHLQEISGHAFACDLPKSVRIGNATQSRMLSTSVRSMSEVVKWVTKVRTKQWTAPHKSLHLINMWNVISELRENSKRHKTPCRLFKPAEVALQRLTKIRAQASELEIVLTMQIFSHHIGDILFDQKGSPCFQNIDLFYEVFVHHITSLVTVYDEEYKACKQEIFIEKIDAFVHNHMKQLCYSNGAAFKNLLVKGLRSGDFSEIRQSLNALKQGADEAKMHYVSTALCHIFSKTHAEHREEDPCHPLWWFEKSMEHNNARYDKQRIREAFG